MSQDISIIIKSKLDTSQQQITSLEEQIKLLSSKIKTAISVKLNIESKDIQLITEKIKEAQEKANKSGNKSIKVGNFDEANKEMNRMISNFDRIRDHFKSLGDNIKIKQVFSNADESLKKFEVSVDRLNGKIKETSNFKVNIETDKDGKETLAFKNITMASKDSTEKVIKDTNKKTEATQKEITEIGKLILQYKAATISAKEFMDVANRLYTNKVSKNSSITELQEMSKLLQALTKAQREYDSSIGQETKNNINIVNSAYAQQEQALKNIFALSKQRLDAEKNGYIELNTQLKEQIRLEGQKLTLARNDIKSNSLTNSAKEVELLHLKNNLQTDYNNKKSKESDIIRQDLHNAQQILNNYLVKMQGDIARFKKQFEGQFNTLKFDTFQQKVLGLQIDPNSSNKVADLTAKIKALNTEFGSMKSEAYANGINAANKATMSFGQQIQLIISKFSMWIGISTVVMGAIHRLTEAFDYMLEQTKLFTNLQMEMTNQNLKFNEVTQTALDFAKAMGTTSAEVMKSISVFGTYVSTMDQVLERSEAAIILANISGRSILEVSDDLMAAQTQFRLGSDQLMSIVDTYASVARNLQVDFPKALGEISSGLKYVGSVAAEAKMPIQDLIAIQGTLVEVTRRSGSQIANGLKTIFSRIGRVGEESNPEEFDGIEKAFYKIGVTIKDSADTIKPMNQILKETAERWKTLNDVERQALATSAANLYQRNTFIALMNNFDSVLANTEAAYNSESVAMQKQDIYMKSLYASLQKLQNAWEQLYNNTISSSMWKYSADGITSVMDGFNKLADIVGGLPALMGAAVASLALFSSKARTNMSSILGSVQPSNYVSWNKGQQGPQPPANLSGGLQAQIPIWNNLTKAVSNYNTKLQGAKLYNEQILGQKGMYQGLYNHWTALTTSVNRYTTGVMAARVATIALQTISTIGLTVAFSMAVGWVFKYVDGLIHVKEKQQELFESLKNDVDTLSSELSNSEKLIKTYNSLANGAAKTAEEKEKLADVTEKLSALYPSSIENIDAEGNAISLSSEKLQEYLNLKEQELEYKRQELSGQFYKTGNDNINDLLINEKNIKSTIELLDEYNKNKKDFLDSGMDKNNKSGYKTILEDISETETKLLKLKSESIKTIEKLKTGFKATLQNKDGFKDFKTQELDNFVSSLLKSKDVLEQIKKSGGIEIFSASLIDNGFANTFNDINKEFTELSKNTSITQKDIDEFNKNAISKLTVALSYLGSEADDVAKVIADKFGLSVKEAKEEVVDFASKLSDVQSQLSDSAEIIKPIKSALDEYNETGKFNIDTLIDLAKKHTELIPILGDEEAVHQALIDIMQKEQDKAKQVYINMLMQSEDFYKKSILLNTSLVKELNNKYKINLNDFKNLADAKKAIESNLIGELAKKWSKYYDAQGFKNNEYEFKMNPETKKLYLADKKTGKFVTDDQEIINSYGQLQKANADIADSFRKIADESSGVDFSKIGDDTKDSTNSSKELSEAKTEEALAWEKVTNRIKKYDNALNKLESITENQVKGSKARRDALHEENEEIKKQLEYLRKQRDGLDNTSSSTSNIYTPSSTGKAKGIVDIALDSLGTPYKWGGNDLKIGVDCSGLVQQAYKEEGISVPRVTYDQYKQAPIKGLKQNELQKGDLVFFNNLEHVGIYMGNDKFIESPHTGANVRTSTLSSRSDFYAGARYLPSESTQKTVNVSRSAIDRYNISPEVVDTVLSLAQKYNVDPALILAIGQHETGWGKLGDGKRGMYTGYGSYDSGSDYSNAGLEKQVEGTVKKMLAWGMTPDNTSFDRLNQGNNGNLPTGIYATDNNWQNSVWNLRKEFSDGQITTSVDSKTELSYEKIAEDRIKHQEEINAEILKLEKEFTDNSIEWYADLWVESDNIQRELDSKIEFSRAKQETMPKDSQQYRDELELQIEYLKKKQIQKAEEAKQMDQAIINMKNNVKEAEILDQKIADMKKGIEDGTFTDLQAIDDLQSQRNLIPVDLDAIAKLQEARKQLSTDWWSLQNEINNTSFEKITSKIEEFDNAISNTSNNTSNLESELSMLTKGTSNYNAKLKEVILSHKQELLAIQNKKAYLKEQLLLLDKNSIAYKNLNEQLQETISAEFDNKQELYNKQEQAAEEIIQIYKDVYEKQKDIALEAEDERHDKVIENYDIESNKYEENINNQIDAIEKQSNILDSQHDKMISALDDEINKYDEIYDAKLKLFDDQNNEQDYQSQLTDLQNEKKDIENSILTLKPDNSPEARLRVDELNNELIAKNKEINNLKLTHNREAIKDELNLQRDAYKKQIEAKKKLISDSYNLDKSNLENSKQAYNDDFNSYKSFMQMKKDSEDEYYESQKNIISDYYDEIINDERRWARVREDVISGNLSNIRNDFNNFGVYLNSHMEDIGTSITTNITDKMKQAIAEAKALGSEIENINNSNIGNQTGSTGYTTAQARQFWDSLDTGESYESAYQKAYKKAKNNGYTYFYMNDAEDANRLYYRTSDQKFLGTTDPITEVQYGNIGNSGNTGNTGDSGSGDNDTGNSDNDGHSKYYKYKSIIDNIITQKKKWQEADENDNESGKTSASAAAAQFYQQLRNAGQEELVNILTGLNYSGVVSWKNKNVYHDGGIVGNQSSSPSKIMDIVNKLFNVKPNESIVKMLKGELAIPQRNVLSNFIPNMQNLVNSIIPNNSPAVISSPTNTYNLNIKIDSMNGSKSDINNFATKIINGVKRLGG